MMLIKRVKNGYNKVGCHHDQDLTVATLFAKNILDWIGLECICIGEKQRYCTQAS